MMKHVVCPKCNKEVPENHFYKNKRNKPNGQSIWVQRPECKDCFKEVARQAYQKRMAANK